MDIMAIQDWLLVEGRQSVSISDLLSELCVKLRESGIPLDRATMGAPLFHPIAQSSFASWSEAEGGKDNWLVWTSDNIEALKNSPIHDVYEYGKGCRLKFADRSHRERFAIGTELYDQGFQEYTALPLQFSDGTSKVLTCATKQSGGFSDREYQALERICAPLASVVEILVQKNTIKTILETYVGKRAADNILEGNIHRGDGANIPAVIWFCDLRGFTALSDNVEATKLLALLNTYFQAVTSAIDQFGGETLKFIGDAVLAIFPIGDNPAGAALDALRAARHALNQQSGDGWPDELKFAVALHAGDVFFGNVGGKDRLDFTVTGSQVNLASRIEGLCAELGENLLVSDDFRRICPGEFSPVGDFNLKGITQEISVFSPLNQ